MKRKLILVPHPDDEILMCAGVLQQAAEGEADVWVCIVTNGDYESEALVALRMAESKATLDAFKISETNMIYMGYADTGMDASLSFLHRLWAGDTADRVLPSRWGRRETWLPEGRAEYHFSRTGKHAPYTLGAVRDDIAHLLSALKPDEIYTTATFDLHGDHSALGLLVLEEAGRLRGVHPDFGAEIYQFLVHAGDDCQWPNRGWADARFTRPAKPLPGLCWENRVCKPLPPPLGGQGGRKHKLIEAYRSQHPEGDNGYLLSFAKEEEVFFPVSLE